MRRKRIQSKIVKENPNKKIYAREEAEVYTNRIMKSKPIDATPTIKNAIANRSKYSKLKEVVKEDREMKEVEAKNSLQKAIVDFPKIEGEEKEATMERFEKHLSSYGIKAVRRSEEGQNVRGPEVAE